MRLKSEDVLNASSSTSVGRFVSLDSQAAVVECDQRQVDRDAAVALDHVDIERDVVVVSNGLHRSHVGEVCGDVAAHLEVADRHLEPAQHTERFERSRVVVDVERQLFGESEERRRCLFAFDHLRQFDAAEIRRRIERVLFDQRRPTAGLHACSARALLVVERDEVQVDVDLVCCRQVYNQLVRDRTDQVLRLNLRRQRIIGSAESTLQLVAAPLDQSRITLILQDSPKEELDRLCRAGLGDHGRVALVELNPVGRDRANALEAVVSRGRERERDRVAADEHPLAGDEPERGEVENGRRNRRQ